MSVTRSDTWWRASFRCGPKAGKEAVHRCCDGRQLSPEIGGISASGMRGSQALDGLSGACFPLPTERPWSCG